MWYLANPSTEKVREAMRAGRLAYMDTPKQGNKFEFGVTWAADNGCFGEGYPGDDGWLKWLANHPGDRALCLFASAPDVVGDAEATLDRSLPWLPQIRALGYPAAFVAQNGAEEPGRIPWDAFDVLFLGGAPECLTCGWILPLLSPARCDQCAADKPEKHCLNCSDRPRLAEWKIGRQAGYLAKEAKRRGKRVHMGRVNSRRRFTLAQLTGCASADGTYIKRGPDKNLPKALGWGDNLLTELEVLLAESVAAEVLADATRPLALTGTEG